MKPMRTHIIAQSGISSPNTINDVLAVKLVKRIIVADEADETLAYDILPSSAPKDDKVLYDGIAQELRQEEEAQRKLKQKMREEEMQLKLELEAEKKGLFAKNQNVMYHHKLSDTKYYSQVVGVHFDDGPDKPYYVRFFFAKYIYIYIY